MIEIEDLGEEELAYYEERAAILQFDGGLTRPEAERRALQETLKKRELF